MSFYQSQETSKQFLDIYIVLSKFTLLYCLLLLAAILHWNKFWETREMFCDDLTIWIISCVRTHVWWELLRPDTHTHTLTLVGLCGLGDVDCELAAERVHSHHARVRTRSGQRGQLVMAAWHTVQSLGEIGRPLQDDLLRERERKLSIYSQFQNYWHPVRKYSRSTSKDSKVFFQWLKPDLFFFFFVIRFIFPRTKIFLWDLFSDIYVFSIHWLFLSSPN